jgi:hypothetical protein
MAQICNRYLLFNKGDIDGMTAGFASNADYLHKRSGRIDRGRTAIRQTLTGLGTCFEGAQIDELTITDTPERLGEVPGAEQCVTVTFSIYGRYVQTLPGLEDIAPADSASKRLTFTEVVWIGPDDLYMRVVSDFDVNALH